MEPTKKQGLMTPEAGWRSWLARLAHNQKVPRSTLGPAILLFCYFGQNVFLVGFVSFLSYFLSIVCRLSSVYCLSMPTDG